jgi:hypothetical protein
VSVHSETLELDTAGTRVRALPLVFPLPAGAPSTRLSAAPRVYWRLLVRIPTAGPDFTSDHLVPVYAAPPG